MAASCDSEGPGELQSEFQQAAEALRRADALLICTGAGMGVDSGLGTFRGRYAGVWPPLRALNMDYVEICAPNHFESDPRLAWAFWSFCYQTYAESTPHPGYRMLARWGSKLKHGLFSVTSNIDGHWARVAGVGPKKIYEAHGAVTHLQSLQRDDGKVWKASKSEMGSLVLPKWDLDPGEQVEVQQEPEMEWIPAAVADDGRRIILPNGDPVVAAHGVRRPGQDDLCRLTETSLLPLGPHGGLARPNVLMFGDGSWVTTRIADQLVNFDRWKASLPTKAQLVIVEVGAGTTVSTIRDTSEEVAASFVNSTLIRINLEDSDVPSSLNANSVSIGGMGALQALTQLDRLIRSST